MPVWLSVAYRLFLDPAVRRDPDTAIVALQALGYTVTEPDRSVVEQSRVIPLHRPAHRQRGR